MIRTLLIAFSLPVMIIGCTSTDPTEATPPPSESKPTAPAAKPAASAAKPPATQTATKAAEKTTAQAQAQTAAQAQVAVPQAPFAPALSAATGQCIAANETGKFSPKAMRAAGFVNSQYNAEEFRVQLNGAQAGQAFSVFFPKAGAEGCRIVTRYGGIAPAIATGALHDMRAAGYVIQGSGKNMTANKAERALSIKKSRTQATSIPFYELSIQPQ